MKNLSIILICLVIFGCSRTLITKSYNSEKSSEGIYYNLPKSLVKLDIQYSLYRDYNLVNGQKKFTSNTYAKIENPITISSIPVPDEEQKYILTYKKNDNKIFFDDSYTVELNQNGTIKSLNWETENIIPNIASNIISSGLNVFKTLSPAEDKSEIDRYLAIIFDYEKTIVEIDSMIFEELSNNNFKKIKELKEIQELIIGRVSTLKSQNKKNQKEKIIKSESVIVDIEKDYTGNSFIVKKKENDSLEFKIDLKSRFKGVDEESFPKLIFTIPINQTRPSDLEGLKYRVPKKVNYTLKLIDAKDIYYPERILVNNELLLLQYGDLNTFPLKVKGSKKSKTAITIDENTGLITKVSNTNNSILKESSSLLKASTEELYKTFNDYSFNKKKTDLEKEKALLELNKSIEELNKDDEIPSDLEIQIKELKMILERLDLERKIKELESEK